MFGTYKRRKTNTGKIIISSLLVLGILIFFITLFILDGKKQRCPVHLLKVQLLDELVRYIALLFLWFGYCHKKHKIHKRLNYFCVF